MPRSAPRVVVTLRPEAGEREAVDAVLGDDAIWLVDLQRRGGPGGGSSAGRGGGSSAGPGGAPSKGAPGVPGRMDADVALCFWPREELRRAGLAWGDLADLRLIQVATAGVNHIGWRDVPDGVQVANAPGSSAGAVAEYILAAILGWARGFQPFTRAIRAGGWPLGAPVRALSELRIGLVGFGGIGRAAAALLAGGGASVRAVSRSGRAPGEARRSVQQLGTMDDLPDMASWCDVLVCCLPLVKETLGLVEAGLLVRMAGRDALVVNVSRGPVVDEGALFEWLQADPDRRSAVLDVWWRYPKEPHERPFNHPFDRLDNVVMTPHNAPNVSGFRLAMVRQAAEQVRHYLDSGEALHVQDRDAHLLDVEGDGR